MFVVVVMSICVVTLAVADVYFIYKVFQLYPPKSWRRN